jgi:predicted neutral ceramidase superfamily lipid hydrolase
MQFIRSLCCHSKANDWKEGGIWFIWQLSCGLMPIWITLLLLRISKQSIEMHVFTNNGEFALYSASFLGSCFYIILRDIRKNQFPNRSLITLIIVLILILSSLMYSIIALLNLMIDPNITTTLIQFDREFLRNISLGLLPIVLIISLLIVVADNVISKADIKKMAKEDLKRLDFEFENTEET